MKLLRILLALTVAFALAACGGDDGADVAGDADTDATPTDIDTPSPTEPDDGEDDAETPDEGDDGEDTATGVSGDPIRIGAVLGISGRFAFVGSGQQNALQLFADQVNAEDGIAGRPVEFVIYDDEVDDTQTVQLTNRLIGQDDVVAIIGPSITIPALAIAPLVEREQIPNMTLTSAAIWEEQDAQYIFQTTPREEIETLSVLSFIRNELNADTVAVLYDDQPYGTRNLAFLEEFAPGFDLEIVATESISNDATNAVPQLERLRGSDADSLIVWVGDPAASSTARGLEQVGWDVPMIGSSAIAGPRFVELAGPAAEGVYSDATLDYADPPENQAAFIEAYTERFDAPPTQFAAFAWDAALALKQAIEHADGDTSADAIVQAMYDMPPVEGVNATIDFTPENHNGIELRAQFLIVQVQDGQFAVVADTSEFPAHDG
jgi:branched-chain amino acid transport system substrate-binding protein